MQATPTFVTPQCLETVHKELAADFSPVLDFLRLKLAEKSTAAGREYAELREAKYLISIMRYAGFTAMVRSDEMAWALQYARDAYARESRLTGILCIEKAAQMLALDLKTPHAIPLDLARRITNELALLKTPSPDRTSELAHAV